MLTCDCKLGDFQQCLAYIFWISFQFSVDFSLLLTGTPIQNSLQELYALLAFIEPDTFPKEGAEEFVSYYHGIEKESQAGK